MERFVACFADLSDSRASNARRHDFHELLIIALCTVLGDVPPYVEIFLAALPPLSR